MNKYTLLALAPLGLASACTTLDDVPTDRVAEARLQFATGLPAGTVQILGNGQTLNLSAGVVGMTPGVHGIHLHAVGRCDAQGFTSAGGHLNPGNKTHGPQSANPQHLGDLPNITVGESRSGTLNVDLEGMQAALLATMFDGDGTAVVVHAGPDDYRTDPAGNSGDRIACGVLRRVD